jgi:CBS domain-containing protein
VAFVEERKMQIISEVMSRNAQVVSPGDSLQRAAQLMGDLNVGSLPVCDGERIVGMVTDRDIAVRGTAAGKAPGNAHVDEVMTTEVRWCFEDQPLDEVMRQMADSRVRRIPVVSHDEQHKLVGIVALGDLAIKAGAQQEAQVEQLVEKVSAPGHSPGEPGTPAATGQAPHTEKTPSGVLEAMTGIDQRAQPAPPVGVPGASGQPRIDPAGEPFRTAGGVKPEDVTALGKDREGPPGPDKNAV